VTEIVIEFLCLCTSYSSNRKLYILYQCW